MQFVDRRMQRGFLDACAAIEDGALRVVTPDGAVHDFGRGGPAAEMRIRDWAMVARCAARGDAGLGEAYVDGLWQTGSVEAVGQVALRNLPQFSHLRRGHAVQRLRAGFVDRVLRANSRRGSRRNIRAHYDVGNEFYQLWLDQGMSYSSALFAPADTDLGRAQDRKYGRVLSRLGSGETVLEIGCGWGGFAEAAAEQGRRVTALTISRNQAAYADARLDGRAQVCLMDYRDADGQYDNIVSIEMIEAVGERYWPSYFGTLKRRLAAGGTAMVQAIVVRDDAFADYRSKTDFIRQHVFPGGMLLSQAEIARQAAGAGLQVADCFGFGRDYAQTCRIWAANLAGAEGRAQRLGFGPAFLRSWAYYLGISAAAFEVGRTDVVQVELRHG